MWSEAIDERPIYLQWLSGLYLLEEFLHIFTSGTCARGYIGWPETYSGGKPLEHKTILSWASLTENSTVKMFKILGSHSRIYTERITINEHLYRKDLKCTDKYVTILTN